MSNSVPSCWNTVAGITDRLKALHKPGDKSMRDMARILSSEFQVNISRNAIISKLRRLGMTSGPKNRKKKKKKTEPPKPRPKVKTTTHHVSKFTYFAPEPPRIIGLNLQLHQLNNSNCHFPTVGDRAPYLFCGLKADERCSYCLAHRKLAFKQHRICHGPPSARPSSPFRNVRSSVRWSR